MASVGTINLNQIYITRFVAALLVVVYHFGLSAVPFDNGNLHWIATYGNEAVNYFFCLSGYILVIAYYTYPDNKAVKSGRFLLNRFARIYPVYFLSLLLVALYYWFIDSSIFSSFSVRFGLELILLQSWVGKTSLNFPGWSLSVEMFFYLLFPILLKRLAQIAEKRLVIVGLLGFIILQCIYIVLLFQIKADAKKIFALEYFPLMNLMTFVLGMITGITWKRYSRTILASGMRYKIGGYLACAIIVIILVYTASFQQFHRVGLLAPVYCIFFIAFSIPSGLSRWLGNAVFVFLGDISYSIYILQFPVYLYFRHWSGIQGSLNTAQFYQYLLNLLFISAIVYRGYELKLQQRIKGLKISKSGS
jgi:peptidoglycan/LPS O-acetylase OafA/YrhL